MSGLATKISPLIKNGGLISYYRMKFIKLFALISIGVCASILAGELLLKSTIGLHGINFQKVLMDIDSRVWANKRNFKQKITRRDAVSNVETDQDGIRLSNNLPEAENNILLVGDSFVFGLGVNDNETFTALLNKRSAKSNFINLGCIGYSTVQEYLWTKEVLSKFNPQKVILFFYLDDVEANLTYKSLLNKPKTKRQNPIVPPNRVALSSARKWLLQESSVYTFFSSVFRSAAIQWFPKILKLNLISIPDRTVFSGSFSNDESQSVDNGWAYTREILSQYKNFLNEKILH